MSVYAIANNKGGVGKTTTAQCFAGVASENNLKALLFDLDPAAGLTKSFRLDPSSFGVTTYDVLIGRAPIKDAIVQTNLPGIDLIPANENLKAAEPELLGEMGWESVLKDLLSPILASYDRIFLDCPPALGLLTANALVAAQTVVVPLQCEFLAMQAIADLRDLIEKVKQKANPELDVRILRTMYDGRTTHAREVSDEIQKVFGTQVLGPIIKRTIMFADSTVAGQPIVAYAKASDVAQAYRDAAAEI